jgi:23S rRNA (uridine2552-2'-O)-methyltransferase
LFVPRYQHKDRFYRQAKEEGYRSRAAYKLLELNKRLRLFSRGMKVLDLGCSPGGWMQVAAAQVGPTGRVVGVDLEEIPPLGEPQVQALAGDIRDPAVLAGLEQALGGPADLVLSDMAPDTSGVHFADHTRSVELVRAALIVAERLLKFSGTLVAKVFDGEELPALVQEIRKHFAKVQHVRPEATRKGSREVYLVATGKKAPSEDRRPETSGGLKA